VIYFSISEFKCPKVFKSTKSDPIWSWEQKIVKLEKPRFFLSSSSSSTNSSKEKSASGDLKNAEPSAKKERIKIDFDKTYTENIYITPVRAMLEYYIEQRSVFAFYCIFI
jgi:hypothetical protein